MPKVRFTLEIRVHHKALLALAIPEPSPSVVEHTDAIYGIDARFGIRFVASG